VEVVETVVAALSKTHYHHMLQSNQWQEKCSVVSLPPRVSHITTTVILQANVGISCSVALKVMFLYLHTVWGRRNLYSIFQEKRVPYGLENTVYIRWNLHTVNSS